MPRKLAVYTIMTGGAGGFEQDDVKGFTLIKQYEHILQRLAYNFCYGPFGGVHGRDYLCVQSFDGQLAFFEQDHFVFARYIADSLIPGPICYSKGMDSFVTANSKMEIEAYKYQVLAASSGSNEKDANQQGGKKVQVDWSANVGEEIYDIRVAKFSQFLSNTQTEIVAIGERTLFCIRENGSIASQKRLDYFPSVLCPYNQTKDPMSKHNLIIGTHSKSLMIYKDPKLIWASGTNSVPVSVYVGRFGGISGMIVLLDDEGHLTVNYLGSDPVSNPIPTMESKEVDYAELESEHRKLQAFIRQTQAQGKQEPSDKLLIRAQVPIAIDQDGYDGNRQRKVTVKIYLGFTGEDVALSDVTLNVNVQQPLTVQNSNVVSLGNIRGGSQHTPIIVPIVILGGDSCIPSSLQCDVMAVYTTPNGESRTASCTFSLPFSLTGHIVPQKKSATFKLTIDTNRGALGTDQIFEDLMEGTDAEWRSSATQNSITFQYNDGSDVTMLVSKNAGRYRIQSGTFDALWLFTSELVRRIKAYFAQQEQMKSQQEKQSKGKARKVDDDDFEEHEEETKPDDKAFSITFDEGIPYRPFFDVVDQHLESRWGVSRENEKLTNLAAQIRSVQKRLLIRFKERNPTPLNNIDLLFEDTYRRIIDCSKKMEDHQANLKKSTASLSCAISMILLLVQIKHNLPERDIQVLKEYLSPNVNDCEEQGWEEMTEASVNHLIRTGSKAANAKELVASVTTTLEMPKDTSNLKRVIVSLNNKIQTGDIQLYKEPKAKDKKGGKAKSKKGEAAA
jgi:Bardet-Biedl syndrome 9 protein